MSQGQSALPGFLNKVLVGGGVRITAMGSSTIEGTGASRPEASCMSVAERVLQRTVPGGATLLNRGVGGQIARQFHDRVEAVIADRSDLVIWQCGSNDLMLNIGLEEFNAFTRLDLQTLKNEGFEIVLMDLQHAPIPEAKHQLHAYLKAVHDIGRDMSIPVFNRYARMRSWCDELGFECNALSPDGVHMADQGHALLGVEFAHWLIDIAQIPARMA